MERESRSLCSIWRNDDYYAICHLVDISGYENTQFAELEDDPDFHRAIERELSSRDAYPDLRRGDLIFIQSHLGTRNEGKMIYDGHHVIPLEYILDDHGNIPTTFQSIVEFPSSYWVGFLTHSPIVPFSFSQHISNPTLEEIRGYNKQWVFPMIGIHNEIFAIFSQPYEWMTKEEFLAKLRSTNYYDSYESANYTFALPPEIRADNVLVLPEESHGKKSTSSDDLDSIWDDRDCRSTRREVPGEKENIQQNNYTRVAWGRASIPRSSSMETIRGDRRDAEDSDTDYYGYGSGYETDDGEMSPKQTCGFEYLTRPSRVG